MTSTIGRHLANAAVAVGGLASLAAMLVSLLKTMGLLPAVIAMDDSHYWSSYVTLYRIPVELAYFSWFCVAGLARMLIARHSMVTLHLVVMVGSAAVAGAAVGQTVLLGGRPYITVAIALSALALRDQADGGHS